VKPSALPVSKRVQQSRDRRRDAGFKRVELFVPADKVELVRAYVAQLREGSESEALGRLRGLIAKAYRKYHARCLDNISVDPKKADFADAAIVAAALMHRGNSEAFELGKQIKRLAR